MPDDVVRLHRRACEGFGARVHAVRSEQWSAPTPCAGWDVRALVAHVVAEDLWAVPLLAGKAIADVGDAFDGDVLGADPVAAADAAAAEALAAAAEAGVPERTVHLSFGDTAGEEYLRQLLADHLVHGWDLAVATGGDRTLDPELVAACASWFAGTEGAYRAAGVVGPRAAVAPDADPQTRLLAAFGRRPVSALEVVTSFNAAFEKQDVDGVMALMTEDCVFEGTAPPDGTRQVGRAQVRAAWEEFFAASPDAAFSAEEVIEAGERVVVRWRYAWPGGHVRGVDVFRVRDGLVAEKLAYVKG